MLKASAGGGGKGMRKVNSEKDFSEAFERAQNESIKAFGSADVYMEKFVENPKHIEVQIIGDKHGNYVHLFERECSVQRRHQKVVEEATSISVDEETRDKITQAGINAAKACEYFNAGTIEFLMDKDKNFYFLEMNTRLQVEHPVTELITGIDIVKEQINIAAGGKLSFSQSDVIKRGHAIECRIYAEDVDNNFAPSTGKILHHRLPSGPGIRVDRGIDLLTDVPVYYDPLLSKLTTYGKDRAETIARMKIALGAYQIAGVITNISFLEWIIDHPKFVDGSFDINFIDNEFMPNVPYKWREKYNEKYEDVAAIIGALLKHKNSELGVGKIESNHTNKWLSQLHE
jgi:acetyl/propionyl-CoA carboxylase alpha subunit